MEVCSEHGDVGTRKLAYIAGPMRGVPLFNFPAFFHAEVILRQHGFIPINPARMDIEAGLDPWTLKDWDWHKFPEHWGTLDEVIERDVESLMGCDSIHMLPNWEKSVGARAEHALAVWMGKEVMYGCQGHKSQRCNWFEESTAEHSPSGGYL